MSKINIYNLKKKKNIVIVALIFIVICVILIVSLYWANRNFRNWMDINIFGKSLTEEDVQIIDLNTDKSNQVHVYGNHIAILNEKTVTLYNQYGEKEEEIKVDMNTGIFNSEDKYLIVAEKQGTEICLIFDKTYLWSTNVEGEILQAYVNRNGYVAVITKDVTNKSILTFFNSEGKKLFTSYFASTRITDVSISKDNKYIAIAELDTTGTLAQSSVKIISVENAQKDVDKTIIYTHNLEHGRLITNVEYQDKGQIAYVYDDGIGVIKDETNKQILKIGNDENITFIGNNLNNEVVYVEEMASGLFNAESKIHIVNTSNDKDTIYEVNEVVKEIYAKEDIIGINSGTQISFITPKGLLAKKYTSRQEITNVEFSKELVAIIYKDKIIIVNL